MKKIREQDGGGGDAGSAPDSGTNSYASLVNVPGMGDPKMPSGDQPGSGDLWPNLMDFMTWKSRKKGKKRAKKRKRS